VAEPSNRNDPFVVFRFQVAIDNMPVAGFSECSGLTLETEVKEYPEGGLNTHLHKFPGRVKQTNITLKRGIVDRKLWDWFYALSEGDVQYKGGTITVHDPSGANIVMRWEFKRAFPVKWMGPDLNATQNSVAVETLELAHHGLQRQV
jgi:phage tail-like protein